MNDIGNENFFEFDLPALDFLNVSNSPTVPATGEKYLVFCWDEELFAVSTNRVAEVAPTLSVTTLPHAPQWLLGITNLRGEIISVVSLPVALKKKVAVAAPKPKFIVLRSNFFESGVAFTADRISEIVTLSANEIERSTDHKSSPVFAKAVHKSQTLNLVDTEKLLASLKI